MISLFIRYDYVSYGCNGVGEEVVGEVAYILAEEPSGKRWIYIKGFALTERGYDEDGFLHAWRRKGAEAELDACLAELEAKQLSDGILEMDGDWFSTEPCYGSESWTQANEVNLMDDAEFAAYMGYR